jgi:acetate kinase
MRVLCVNVGSESRKYAYYEGDDELWSEHIENRHERLNPVRLRDKFDVVAMRVVAPGAFFQLHRGIDIEYMHHLERARELAPLHVEPIIKEIQYFKNHFPKVPQVAISDSAFHATIPAHARQYAIPAEDAKKLGIEKYGYHGISLSYVVDTLKKKKSLPGRLIVCHLGGGSSITAIKDGKSIDTTMGMTPLAGLPMATRVGDIDPGALVYLATAKKLTNEKLEEYLTTDSGFLGIAGTADMRELLAREKTDPGAALAIQMFVYQIQKYIGAYTAALGGLDTLVFTGTIGERSEPIRSKVLASQNLRGTDVVIMPTNEMVEMARLVHLN